MAGKSKKSGIKKLQINFTNRWLYTLIVFFSLVVIGVFVYATTPNPGHDITQIAPPDVCSADQFLKWTTSGWTCEDVSVVAETDPLWTGESTNVAFINKGNAFGAFTQSFDTNVLFVDATNNRVGIGTTSPAYKLDVDGGALISGNLHVGGFAAYSGAFIGYYDGACDIDHTGVIRYIEDYCNGVVYMAGLQVCTKTGTDTASWKFANSYSYGSCGSPGGGDPGGCFPAGTKVIMFDNSLKNIEDITEEDYVLSYDEESGEYVPSKVEKLLVHTEENTEEWSEGLYNIITSDGSNREITGNHPVYTKTDTGWKYNNVENLVLGDAVKIYKDGELKEVYIVSIDFIEEDLKVVYNLRLTKPNTYFAEGLLVHNLKDIPL